MINEKTRAMMLPCARVPHSRFMYKEFQHMGFLRAFGCGVIRLPGGTQTVTAFKLLFNFVRLLIAPKDISYTCTSIVEVTSI